MERVEGRIYLDGVCYHGPRQRFDPAELGEVVIVAGLELLRADQPAAVNGPEVRETEIGALKAVWPVAGGQELLAPTLARSYH
jgi:hypothetical protein